MAQFALPNSDITNEIWFDQSTSSTNIYLSIDEGIASADEDTTQIHYGFLGFGNNDYECTITDVTDPVSNINHIIRFRAKQTAGTRTLQAKLVQGTTIIASSAVETLTSTYQTFTYTLSAAEADSIVPTSGNYTDLRLRFVPTGSGFNQATHITAAELEVPDVGISNHPAPTSPEIDLKSTPATGVQEIPTFTAVFQTTSDGPETTVKAFVQVASDSAFTTLLWDSPAQTITSIGDNTRCDLIDYGGTNLSSDVTYYWRIKFEDTIGAQSDWSATQQFTGVTREWANEDYAFRRELTFPATHVALPIDHTIHFDIKTGNRKIVATNGYIDEAIASSAGWQIASYGTKTHIVYLSQDKDPATDEVTEYSVTIDKVTGEIGTPVKIGNAHTFIDTHHFPTFCIDNDGYIYVFYGCHNHTLFWKKSTLPNDFGSLSSDTGGWGSENSFTNSFVTYPKAFVVPSTNAVYVIVRGNKDLSAQNYQTLYYYTEDGGATWTGPVYFIRDTSSSKYRIYCYGVYFDEERERLSIAWSFTRNNQPEANFSVGIWTAYSDYDSMGTYGFDDFFQLGNATKVGTSSTTITDSGIMNDTGVSPLILSDPENQYFPLMMIVNPATGYPIVFYRHQFREPASEQEYAGFSCQRWDGTAWTSQVRITESVDMRSRVGRSGFPSTYDRNGNLHSWFARDYRKQTHHLPTADVTDLNVTRSTGTDNFALVDDGIEYCDGNTTYIEGGATLDASFTSTNIVPTNQTKILSVEIEVAARKTTTTDGSIKLYLNKTGWASSDKSATITIVDVPSTQGNNYLRYSNVWKTNPDTLLDWTKADVDALEFGVEGQTGSGTFRISRCYMRVSYITIANESRGSVEVVELVSSDDGTTWEAAPISENSSFGTPIINTKHHLTGEQIEVVWHAGNNIFYMAGNQPFGKFRSDGNDFRVYKQANPAVELDRLIDYPNLNTTRAKIKLPWAVNQDALRGADDLFAYYGNPNESGVPLADPSNVNIFDDNFETYDDGLDINGVNGWTVFAGSATVSQSPPEHTNKSFAGDNALKLSAASDPECIIGRTLPANTTNVTIEFSSWVEVAGSRDRRGILLTNTAGDKSLFVGMRQPGTFWASVYEINSEGTVTTSNHVNQQQFQRHKIHITGAGAKAYDGDGNLLINYNENTLTDVQDIKFKYPGTDTRLDFVRIYHEISTAVVDQTIT